jgi:hypothetical protein
MTRYLGSLVSIATAMVMSACGNVSTLSIDVVFPDENTKNATQKLFFVVREVASTSTTPCSGLWEDGPLCQEASGELRPCAEYLKLVDYPNRNDVVAAPLDVNQYTVMVYSYSAPIDQICTEDSECANSANGAYCREFSNAVETKACVANQEGLTAIAGGCAGGVVSLNGATDLTIKLEKPPTM